jgi:ATP-dependent Clp protease adapter protein ClpS
VSHERHKHHDPDAREARADRAEARQAAAIQGDPHNDDVNDMLFVVRTLLDLTPLDLDGAKQVMLTAHKHGPALVLVTHKERAELYQDQFRSKALSVSIEPDLK